LVIGAPYSVPIKTGDPNFPSAFGAAYLVDKIKNNNLDFSPSLNKDKFAVGVASCIDPKGADVGWKMRDKFSDLPYKSFKQKRERVLRSLGRYSANVSPYSYQLDGKLIAYHLFRGTFVDTEDKFMSSKVDQITPEQWNKVRKKYAEYFYREMLGDKNSIIRIKNRFHIAYLYLFHGTLLKKLSKILFYGKTF
jgi:hypothetical protein